MQQEIQEEPKSPSYNKLKNYVQLSKALPASKKCFLLAACNVIIQFYLLNKIEIKDVFILDKFPEYEKKLV